MKSRVRWTPKPRMQIFSSASFGSASMYRQHWKRPVRNDAADMCMNSKEIRDKQANSIEEI
jgi:hypothetical protein